MPACSLPGHWINSQSSGGGAAHISVSKTGFGKFGKTLMLDKKLARSKPPCRLWGLIINYVEAREFDMTPEEIVAEISRTNRTVLYLQNNLQSLTLDDVLTLMDAAAMRGFRFGSNVALSMLQGELVVRLSRLKGSNTSPDGGAAIRHS
jgi:hypothetical protein